MSKVPAKFKNTLAAIFTDAARMRLCESSGSEHYSPDDDLSDLVNSYIEREGEPTIELDISDNRDGHEGYLNQQDMDYYFSDSANKNTLERLLKNGDHRDVVTEKIRAEIEVACEELEERSLLAYRRSLMSHLRQMGFDAGLCKSRWAKFGMYPAGEYEYVDVNVGGERLIVEVGLAAEFEIARPTSSYTALLQVLPRVFIGRPEEMKKVVRSMCSAMRQSMKENNLHVPPWRRNGYMQAKWIAPYKRTTNEALTRRAESDEYFAAKRSIGFGALPLPMKSCHYRVSSYAAGIRLKAGYLTVALSKNI